MKYKSSAKIVSSKVERLVVCIPLALATLNMSARADPLHTMCNLIKKDRKQTERRGKIAQRNNFSFLSPTKMLETGRWCEIERCYCHCRRFRCRCHCRCRAINTTCISIFFVFVAQEMRYAKIKKWTVKVTEMKFKYCFMPCIAMEKSWTHRSIETQDYALENISHFS